MTSADNGTRERPPRAAERWLRRSIPQRHAREGVSGDMREEFAALARRRGAFLAAAWYWLTVASVVARYRADNRRSNVASQRSRRRRMNRFHQDFRSAARSLIRSPTFTAVVVLTLALGIGANTVVFTVVNGVLLSPLPYGDPEQLVRLYGFNENRAERGLNFVVGPAFLAYRESDELFAGLATQFTYNQVGADLSGGEEPERILAMPISSGLFEVLGVELLLGREFTRDEERAGVRVAVLSHGLWQRKFVGDPQALGDTIELDALPYTVVGVAPGGFHNPLGGQADVWVPENLQPGRRNSWDNNYLSVVGRLRPGLTIEQVNARLDVVTDSIAEQEPAARGMTARVVPLLNDAVDQTQSMLVVLMGAVGVVLLIACVNVASLFLARGADRSKELAVRAAIGAGRGRLLGELLAESLLVSAVGGATGLLLSFVGVRLVRVAGPELPRLAEIGVDARILAFTLAISLLTGLLFGISPALRLSRPNLERALREEGRGHSGSRGHRRLRDGLVIAQISLAVVLLVGAGLLMKSFAGLLQADIGVRSSNVLTYEVHLPSARYPEPVDRVALYDRFFARVTAIPGVEAAGATSYLPTEGRFHRWNFGRPDIPADERPTVERDNRMVAGDYFEAMGIELIRGRYFDERDGMDAPRAVIINRYLAEHGFPDRDPMGVSIRQMGREWQVVGIVGDTAYDPQGSVVGKLYYPHDQFAFNRNWALTQTVRTSGDPTAIIADVRAELGTIDPKLVLYRVRTMNEVIGRGISSQRFAVVLMIAFAATALGLAAIGVYGVLAYAVSQRTREIGIRMALGADGRRVRRVVTRHGFALTASGLVIGISASLVLSRWISSMLFGVQPNDPWVIGAVGAGLTVIASLAGWLPARRATSVDPLTALRGDWRA